MTNTNAPVPVLDLNDFLGGPKKRKQFVLALEKSLRETGFFYLHNHSVDQPVIKRAFDSLPLFFVDLPLDVRVSYEFPEVGHQWGYTRPGVEKGEFAQVEDTKHFFHFNEEHMVDVPEVPLFTPTNKRLFFEFRRVYHLLMEAVALSLGVERYFFDDRNGNSLLRVLHYPAQDNPETSDERVESLTAGGNVGGMCAARHTDINVLTLLLAREPGLQLFHESKWMPMHISDPDVLIVNCGDMLEHLTGGLYKSGQHRVVCEPGRERYSAPFFGHFLEEVSIVPLSVLKEPNRDRFHYDLAGEFLKVRLEQIGLLKKNS